MDKQEKKRLLEATKSFFKNVIIKNHIRTQLS